MSLEHHPNVFPKGQVCDLFGITDKTLSYWAAHVFTHEKHSERIKLNFRDLCLVACIVHLRHECGQSVQKIRSEHMPQIEEGILRARASGKAMTDLKVTLWNELIFVYDGNVHSNLAEWHKGTVDFKEVWDRVRGIKIKMQELREDFS